MAERHASSCRNARNRAVRIPRELEFELEGTEVVMREEATH
ncbi:AbrB/MazE/SpoVT family DNA-binding domain-containing protein [Piscinibacter koreensis]|nr:AbrB/MazE/SpoVT family DNA-binding domain-containing protein [Schlegelella koreensis]